MGEAMRGSVVKGVVLALCGVSLTALAAPFSAEAQTYSASRRNFDIPAQDMASALEAFGRQSGKEILFDRQQVSGKRSTGVRGTLEPADALRRITNGSGLPTSAVNADTFLVGTRNSVQAPSSAGEGAASADEDKSEEIVVTGSRIRRPGFDTLEAVLVTGKDQIERRGFTNVAQALNETPGFATSGVDPIGSNQGTFNAGQSFVDFFGLGSQRTLTLVNGRRFVSSSTINGSASSAAPGQQVDLNVIPVGLIERVETVAIGGAPIYGSDAIAGTVNIILKDDFEGFQFTAQAGITERGDAPTHSFRALAGTNFGGGRGNVAISAEYHNQEGLIASDRAGRRFSVPNLNGPPARTVIDDLVFGYITDGGLPFTQGTNDFILNAAGQKLQFQNNELVPFVTGVNVYDIYYEGGDGLRSADHLSLLTPTERTIVSGLGHYDLTPNIRAFAELSYARSKGSELAELQEYTSPFFSGTSLPISIDNGFLSPAARDILVANGVTDKFILGRNFSDLVSPDGGIYHNEIDLYRIVGGLSGSTSFFGAPASWDLSLNYGRSRGVTNAHFINNDRFLLAIDAVRDASGNVVCRSGGACVPLNLFGENAFSEEAADYVLDPVRAVSLNKQFVATANFSSSLPFRISTAPIDFNVGVEYRKESGKFQPDALFAAGTTLLGDGGDYLAESGSFDTREIYGELSVPIVSADQNVPVIKSLSLEGAIRYVDNSIAGGAVTWSAGGRFAPRLPGILDGFLFRGVYTQSIRAPAITELFSGASPTRGPIDDPCSQINFDEGNNPTVRESNCRAALGALGVDVEDFQPTTAGLTALGTISGNPNLDNEKAKSWSIGVVFQPVQFPRFRIAVDWSEIKLTGGIESLDIGSIIDACYDDPNFPNSPNCDQFRRLGAGEVGPGSSNPVRVAGDIANGYNSGYVNTASLNFAGLIVAAEYSFGLNAINIPGTISLTAKAFHNSKFDSRATASTPIISAVGRVGVPKWSGQFNLGYSGRVPEFLLQAVYHGPVKNNIFLTSEDIADEDNNIDAYWRFNTTLGLKVNEKFRVQLVVDNVFDRKPSPAAMLSRRFGTYDLLGRRFLISATAGF